MGVAAGCYLVMPVTYSVGSSFGLLIAGHMAQGAADAAMDLGAWAFILQTNPERVGPYTSVHRMMVGLRGALAPMLGTGILGAFGMRPVFLTAAALVVGGIIVLYTARRLQAARVHSALAG